MRDTRSSGRSTPRGSATPCCICSARSAARNPTRTPTASYGSSQRCRASSPDDDGNGITTTYPPVCLPCAGLALRQCPPLRHAHAVLRVRDVQVYGVSGAAFTLTASSAVFREAIDCHYDSPDLASVVAVQQLLRLL